MSRINSIGRVEQAAGGSLLNEMIECIVNDVFEVGEEAIDRVSRRRSIETTTESDQRLLEFACDWTSAVDVLVVAMEKAAEEF